MNTAGYFQYAEISHLPLVVHNILSANSWHLDKNAKADRVLYMEYPNPTLIYNQLSKTREQAIKLLINMDYQKAFSKDYADNPAYLQRDIMADSTKKILEEWDKPSSHNFI